MNAAGVDVGGVMEAINYVVQGVNQARNNQNRFHVPESPTESDVKLILGNLDMFNLQMDCLWQSIRGCGLSFQKQRQFRSMFR
jgi:hypothetical protein